MFRWINHLFFSTKEAQPIQPPTLKVLIWNATKDGYLCNPIRTQKALLDQYTLANDKGIRIKQCKINDEDVIFELLHNPAVQTMEPDKYGTYNPSSLVITVTMNENWEADVVSLLRYYNPSITSLIGFIGVTEKNLHPEVVKTFHALLSKHGLTEGGPINSTIININDDNNKSDIKTIFDGMLIKAWEKLSRVTTKNAYSIYPR